MSPRLQPDPIPLIQIIRERSEKGELSEFEYLQFERSARKLMKVDPANANAALGILACLKGNKQELNKYHSIAIQVSGDSPVHVFNYACSLSCVGDKEQALRFFEVAFRADPTFVHSLDLAIVTAYHIPDTKKLLELFAIWRKIKQTHHDIERHLYLKIPIPEGMDLFEFPEDTKEVFSLIASTLDNDLRSTSEMVGDISDEEFDEMLELANEIEG